MTPDDRERRGEEDEEGLSNLASAYQKAGPYIAASTTLVASVGVFAAVGWWIDGKVGTQKPWFLIGGSVLGMVGGFISFFRQVLGPQKP
jgi:F0F1-type ATP synthase assembly protein I